MKAEYAKESLLRPPVELNSACVAAAGAVVSFTAPWALFMTPTTGAIAGAAMASLAWVRYSEGMRVIRYQRNLKRMPPFTMRSKEIPVSNERLYLGRGFEWTAIHTQRLLDTRAPDAEPFCKPGKWNRRARGFEDFASTRNGAIGRTILKPIARFTSSQSTWNPVPPVAALGGNPALHGVEPDERPTFIDIADRSGHMVSYGATRVGKSRFMEMVVTQDIRRGDVTIVFDPKGDEGVLARMYAEYKKQGKLHLFYVFHLGFPEISAKYNALAEYSRLTQTATRVTTPLPGAANAAAFKAFCWRFVNVIGQALASLGKRATYTTIRAAVDDIEPLFIDYAIHFLTREGPPGYQAEIARLNKNAADEIADPKARMERHLQGRKPETIALLRFLGSLRSIDLVLFALAGVLRYEKAYFDKLVSSLGPLLEKLTTGQTKDLLSPEYYDVKNPAPTLDWRTLITQGGGAYIGLDALTDPEIASTVGSSMFSDFTATAGEIYKHGIPGGGKRRVNVHADEFTELVGPEFIPMANKIGGAGVNLSIYTQSSFDAEAKLGSRAVAAQVIDNMNTVVMFRVKSVETAKLLTEQLPEVTVTKLMSVSGVTDGDGSTPGKHFVSSNQDRIDSKAVKMLAPSDLIDLPKGHCFVRQSGRLVKARIPLLDPTDDTDLPSGIKDVIKQMRKRYSTGETWWQHGAAPAVDFDRYDFSQFATPPTPAALGDRQPEEQVA